MSRPFSPSCRSTEPSNIQNFLHSMIPVVPSKLLDRSSEINNMWIDLDDLNTIEYFTLGDLWRSFDEWSAYGVGTSIVLDHGRSVVQYYVPYLSAIQIYTTKASSFLSSNLKEDDIEMTEEPEVEFWSDGNESDTLTRSLSNNSSKSTSDDTSIDSIFDYEISSPTTDRLGYLYFQYHEVSSPYWRIPLAEKMRNFMPNYPRLVSLKSVDLSPASWMSIAWYPIYQIPTKWHAKDLAASFLTYHTLSSFFQDSALESDYDHNDAEAIYSPKAMEESTEKFEGQIALPPFGLATYRMQEDFWMNKDKYVQEKISDLESAADSWLKQLNFHHHDFHFFKKNF